LYARAHNGTLCFNKIHLITSSFLSCERVSKETKVKKCKPKYRVDIYIGSDNDSRKIYDSYLDKIKKWANTVFPHGYTLVRGTGYYNGSSEDSILLHAFLNYDPALKRQLEKLKQELKQDSILFIKSPADFELV
jgi:hypothetical protein